MPDADRWDWKELGDYLRAVVNVVQRDQRWQSRCASSDLVQETLLRAHNARGEFLGEGVAAQKGFVRAIW